MKRVLTVLAILLIALLPGFALAQRGARPSLGGHAPRPEFLIGSVTKLTVVTGGSTFVLQNGNNTVTIGVLTATPITNLSDDSKATLAEGQVVHVNGTYNTAAKMVAAISIVVNDKQAPSTDMTVTGVVASVNASDGSFVVTLKSSNVSPTGTTVTVVPPPAAPDKAPSSKTETSSAVKVGATVQAEGTFDATTQTLTAAKITLGK